MIKSIKARLLPNNKQRSKLFQFAGASRFAYNWALDKQMENFREGRKLQSDYDLRKEFTVLRNSGEKPWLLDISNNVTKQAIKDLCIAYNEYKMSPTSISGGGKLLTGGELISPASLKGQEEVL